MTEQQWSEIRKLAIQIHDSGHVGTDQMKCAIAAFVVWISQQEDDFILGEVPTPTGQWH